MYQSKVMLAQHTALKHFWSNLTVLAHMWEPFHCGYSSSFLLYSCVGGRNVKKYFLAPLFSTVRQCSFKKCAQEMETTRRERKTFLLSSFYFSLSFSFSLSTTYTLTCIPFSLSSSLSLSYLLSLFYALSLSLSLSLLCSLSLSLSLSYALSLSLIFSLSLSLSLSLVVLISSFSLSLSPSFSSKRETNVSFSLHF